MLVRRRLPAQRGGLFRARRIRYIHVRGPIAASARCRLAQYILYSVPRPTVAIDTRLHVLHSGIITFTNTTTFTTRNTHDPTTPSTYTQRQRSHGRLSVRNKQHHTTERDGLQPQDHRHHISIMPGFDFSNHNRNLALHAQGVPLPKATSTGTTIVGCLYDGGVVIAADTRATSGPIVADKVRKR